MCLVVGVKKYFFDALYKTYYPPQKGEVGGEVGVEVGGEVVGEVAAEVGG